MEESFKKKSAELEESRRQLRVQAERERQEWIAAMSQLEDDRHCWPRPGHESIKSDRHHGRSLKRVPWLMHAAAFPDRRFHQCAGPGSRGPDWLG